VSEFKLGDRIQRVKSIQRQGPRERGIVQGFRIVQGLRWEKEKLFILVRWDHNLVSWIQDNGIEHTRD
jgi:hypothetical protein